jgi:hemoglobin
MTSSEQEATNHKEVVRPPAKAPSILRKEDFRTSTTLLQRMGGEENLAAVIDHFYDLVLADPKLKRFFEDGIRIEHLKVHQNRFLQMAFTEMPKDFDVVNFIAMRHAKLREGKGLNGTHFDLVVGHLVAALKGMWIEPDVLDDIVKLLEPLRVAFQVEVVLEQKRDVKEKKKGDNGMSRLFLRLLGPFRGTVPVPTN